MVAFNANQAQLHARIADLESQVTALRDEFKRTTLALSHSGVGIFDWSMDMKQTYISPTLQQMLGYRNEGIPDSVDAWLNHLAEDDRYRAQTEIREALVCGADRFQGRYRIHRKDGKMRLFLFRAVIMRRSRVEGGDVFRVLGSAIDVSEVPHLVRSFLL